MDLLKLNTGQVVLPADFNPHSEVVDGRVVFAFSSPVRLPGFSLDEKSYELYRSLGLVRAFMHRCVILAALEAAVPEFFGRGLYEPKLHGPFLIEAKNGSSVLVFRGKDAPVNAAVTIESEYDLNVIQKNNMPEIRLQSLEASVNLPLVNHSRSGYVYGLDTSGLVLSGLLGLPIEVGSDNSLVRRGLFNLYGLLNNPSVANVRAVTAHVQAINEFLNLYTSELVPVADSIDAAVEMYVGKRALEGKFAEVKALWAALGGYGPEPVAQQNSEAIQVQIKQRFEAANTTLGSLSRHFPKGIANFLTAAGYVPADVFKRRRDYGDGRDSEPFADEVRNKPLKL
ncbi:hypothetical protein HYU12_00560 [Candidatus Woesearchaeota archaeon]|nr:hypothetical protein [Candidatus Woesearchaeota archaeon]